MPPVDALEIEVEHRAPSGVRIVRARGELDLAAAPALCLAVEQASAAGDGVVVALEYADPAGLHALVRTAREIAAHGSAIVLTAAPEGPLERVLTLTGARAFVRVAASEDAAVRLLTGG